MTLSNGFNKDFCCRLCVMLRNVENAGGGLFTELGEEKFVFVTCPQLVCWRVSQTPASIDDTRIVTRFSMVLSL